MTKAFAMTSKILFSLALGAALGVASSALAQQVYPTPEAAAKDLVDSAKAKTPGFGERILGKDGAELLKSGDPDLDARNLDTFNAAAAAESKIEDGPDGTKLLEVGKNGWTLPLPLVKTGSGWSFDPVRGKEEITDRRIGYDELSAIAACRAYVQAQDEYFRLDPEGTRLPRIRLKDHFDARPSRRALLAVREPVRHLAPRRAHRGCESQQPRWREA